MATQEQIARGAKRNGKTKQGGRLSATFGGGDKGQSMVHWGEVDPSGIVALTSTVSALGGAVTFGGSRDQSALQISVFLDGEKVVRWCDNSSAAEDALSELWEALEQLR